jgi:rhodanese-related sulfurtransferase
MPIKLPSILAEKSPVGGAQSKDELIVHCSVGHRSSLACSILKRRGFNHVTNLLGGLTAWKKLELPIEKNKEAA